MLRDTSPVIFLQVMLTGTTNLNGSGSMTKSWSSYYSRTLDILWIILTWLTRLYTNIVCFFVFLSMDRPLRVTVINISIRSIVKENNTPKKRPLLGLALLCSDRSDHMKIGQRNDRSFFCNNRKKQSFRYFNFVRTREGLVSSFFSKQKLL